MFKSSVVKIASNGAFKVVSGFWFTRLDALGHVFEGDGQGREFQSSVKTALALTCPECSIQLIPGQRTGDQNLLPQSVFKSAFMQLMVEGP